MYLAVKVKMWKNKYAFTVNGQNKFVNLCLKTIITEKLWWRFKWYCRSITKWIECL